MPTSCRSSSPCLPTNVCPESPRTPYVGATPPTLSRTACVGGVAPTYDCFSPSPSRGGPGWGWVSCPPPQVQTTFTRIRNPCRRTATHPLPNPPLEGEGFKSPRNRRHEDQDRKSTRLNHSHKCAHRLPSS